MIHLSLFRLSLNPEAVPSVSLSVTPVSASQAAVDAEITDKEKRVVVREAMKIR